QSLKELYKIGRGPSSSHTIGPERIATYVKSEYPNAKYVVELFGSLALTGEGHGTDRVLKEVLGADTKIIFNKTTENLPHPNTLDVYVYNGDELVNKIRGLSVGGGTVKIDGAPYVEPPIVYKHNTFNDIATYCKEKGISISDYVFETEPDIYPYLENIFKVMISCIEEGLNATGVLHGGLNLSRKAKSLNAFNSLNETSSMLENRRISSYSLAVAEQNADNKTIVTAPTCGASGVLPGVLYYLYKDCNAPMDKIVRALATAGVIGNLVKTNASISGAECGCQAEVGTACSMTAAAMAEVYDLSIDQIECASEIALEHNLGLTCDPVCGLVQIPCIERNAMASIKAVSAFNLAKYLTVHRKISFDDIVKVMYETGKDLHHNYRETSTGGLAKYYK
ncbi:MAG: L-serine ammonia-lyase, iron-sulfur-dependent, subunit alpha, partial [Clostridia bacterium]|nr:L-serine ammonia-lyase, iron-sulfur-dependent, subunit alpha [Clostridia bacterium]